MFIQAITTVVVACGAIIPGCVPESTPLLPPCEGDVVTVYGYDTPTGCDLTPPQELRFFMEHPAPWSPTEADEFYYWCDEYDGVPVDVDGDAWVCGNLSY